MAEELTGMKYQQICKKKIQVGVCGCGTAFCVGNCSVRFGVMASVASGNRPL